MKNFFVFGMLLALFAVSTPLIADPGGVAVAQYVVSDYQFSSVITSVETKAGGAGAVIGATNPAAAESFKSIIYPIAGGVVAILGAILLAMMAHPLFNIFENFKRRQEYEMRAFGLRLKRTKSPVLKMRAAS